MGPTWDRIVELWDAKVLWFMIAFAGACAVVLNLLVLFVCLCVIKCRASRRKYGLHGQGHGTGSTVEGNSQLDVEMDPLSFAAGREVSQRDKGRNTDSKTYKLMIKLKKPRQGTAGFHLFEEETPVYCNGVMVDQVLPKSPAARAGLQVNDRILSINGKSLFGTTYTHACTTLVGATGTVHLQVERPVEEVPEFDLTESSTRPHPVRQQSYFAFTEADTMGSESSAPPDFHDDHVRHTMTGDQLVFVDTDGMQDDNLIFTVVNKSNSETYYYNALSSSSVLSIKSYLSRTRALPVDNQRISLHGHVLDNITPLVDLEMSPQDVLEVEIIDFTSL
eukprot:m.111451 g.111451  ORF g.111451 m.111451 type:complete len:334 (+) comp13445_c2_seq2:349-1350(+)